MKNHRQVLRIILSIIFTVLFSFDYAYYANEDRAKAVVICLHDIGGKGIYSVSRADFIDIMDKIKKYPVLSLANWHNNPGKYARSVILTIDDGYPSLRKFVHPLLLQYNYGATYFIYTDRYESKSPFYTFLSKLPDNFEIGSHSLSHRDLKVNISNEDFYKEVYFSKLQLEFLTGKKIISFAWPYGAYSENLLSAVKRAGYDIQVSTDYKVAYQDEELLPRFTLERTKARKQIDYILGLLD